MMVKKILLILGILVVLFAGVNTTAALNSSIFDAIYDLPLADQVLLIAKEVDRLKLKDELRDACLAEDLYFLSPDYDGPMTLGGSIVVQVENMRERVAYQELHPSSPSKDWTVDQYTDRIKDALAFFESRYEEYLVAKSDCDRLTEEFNQKYGE